MMRTGNIRYTTFICVLICLAAGWAYGQQGESMLTQGSTAPEFSAETFDGKTLELSKLRASGPVILVFLRGFG